MRKTAFALAMMFAGASYAADAKPEIKPVPVKPERLKTMMEIQQRIAQISTELRVVQQQMDVALRDAALDVKLDLETHELKLIQIGDGYAFAVKAQPEKPADKPKK